MKDRRCESYLDWHSRKEAGESNLHEVGADHRHVPIDPGDVVNRDTFSARQVYRFANFLEAYIDVNDQEEIVGFGFTDDSDMYFRPSFRGIMPKAYPLHRDAKIRADERFVRFSQIVGCKTVSPETIGSREAVKTMDAILGIHPGWGGPMGVQAEDQASRVGSAMAENIRVFPPIWTELELKIFVDGSFESRPVRHSLFPSCSYYEQSYTVERLSCNATTYKEVDTYDARSKMDEWRAKGWGAITGSSSGPNAGNPWSEPDPRVIPGRDLPFRPDIPAEKE